MNTPLFHINSGVDSINSSKLFTGIMMILLNLFSKYMVIKLSPSQEAYFRNNIAREVFIFILCWMGTRDVYTSIILTASFYILSQHLLNEESTLCVLPQQYREYHLFDTNKDGIVSQKEIDAAVQLLTRVKEKSSVKQQETIYQQFTQGKH